MSFESVSEMLESISDPQTARRLRKQAAPLRGIRGVSPGAIAQVSAKAWSDAPTQLPRDVRALNALFSTAWEDGLVAIGLLSAALPDAPAVALTTGLEWAGRTDDVITADALGWLVLGPACLALGRDLVQTLAPVRGLPDGVGRRAAVAAGMAATPTPVEGPSAAPIRARLDTPVVRWVEQLQLPVVKAVIHASLRDNSPPVQKAIRRLIRAWGEADPSSLDVWAREVPGGLPVLLRDEVVKARKKASRPSRKP